MAQDMYSSANAIKVESVIFNGTITSKAGFLVNSTAPTLFTNQTINVYDIRVKTVMAYATPQIVY